MDITWKQTMNIPTSWNKPQLIELRANFVHHRGLDLKRTVVFVDEAGFDLHSGRAFGYAPRGNVLLTYQCSNDFLICILLTR